MFDEIAEDADSPAIIEIRPLGSAVIALISAPPDSLGKLSAKLIFLAGDLSDDSQPEMDKMASVISVIKVNEITGTAEAGFIKLEYGLVI